MEGEGESTVGRDDERKIHEAAEEDLVVLEDV